jgi:hypothetical protein
MLIDHVIEMLEIETTEDTNTILRDKTPVSVEGLTKWLSEFKQTHYPNRPLTDQFWLVLKESVLVGVNVVELLGKEVSDSVRDYNPKRFREIIK